MTTASKQQANHPVVGELTPYMSFLRTGFGMFRTAQYHGLAKVVDNHLHILAIAAFERGQGRLSLFLNRCEDAYHSVTVWDLWNQRLAAYLKRRGYRPTVDPEGVEGLTNLPPLP